MAQRDTIVVGASAGGVEALRTLLQGLPRDLPAVILVVVHTAPSGVNALPSILSRSTELSVTAAAGEVRLRRGTVVVARPDHHLVVHDGRVDVTRGPRENGHRPSVDVLFRSAARSLGPRVVGIVLSGALDDGSAGLVAVRSRGGVGIVQDPAEALHPGMPENAIAAADPQYVVPLAEMGALLGQLIGTTVHDDPGLPSPLMEAEVAFAVLDPAALHDDELPGAPSGLSCPDCHGPLFTIEEEQWLRYRCRVGHAWSPESLLAGNDAALEAALWMALRTLEEKASLARRMAKRGRDLDQTLSAGKFAEQAGEAADAAELLRRMLVDGMGRKESGT